LKTQTTTFMESFTLMVSDVVDLYGFRLVITSGKLKYFFSLFRIQANSDFYSF